MDVHYSYACAACVAKYIGPALHSILEPASITTRDKCYGCGVDNTVDEPVYHFSYWYPWPDVDVVDPDDVDA